MRRSPVPLVLALVAVVAVAANAVQFRSIDVDTVTSFRAVHRHDTADLRALMRHDCPSCRERYDLHLALATVAPRARVIIPTPSRYAGTRYATEEWHLRLRTFGAAAEVDWVEAPDAADLLAPTGVLDPSRFIVARGPGGARGAPWALATDPTLYPISHDPTMFVDLAVTGEAAVGAPGREFVLLRWRQPHPGAANDYQDLLLETSLLPAAVRSELTR